MASDSHDIASRRHNIAKESQVTMIDIGAVERQDLRQFPQKSRSCCLNAEDLKYLREFVRVGTSCVNSWDSQNFGERAAAGFKYKLLALWRALLHVEGAVSSHLWSGLLVDERSLDPGNTVEGQVVQHLVHEAA